MSTTLYISCYMKSVCWLFACCRWLFYELLFNLKLKSMNRSMAALRAEMTARKENATKWRKHLHKFYHTKKIRNNPSHLVLNIISPTGWSLLLHINKVLFSGSQAHTLCYSPNKRGAVSNGWHAISPTTSFDDATNHTNMSNLSWGANAAQTWICNWGRKSHAALRGPFLLYTVMFTCGCLWVNVKIEHHSRSVLKLSPHQQPNKYACHACTQAHLHPWTTPVSAYANDRLERERRDGWGLGGWWRVCVCVCWGEGRLSLAIVCRCLSLAECGRLPLSRPRLVPCLTPTLHLPVSGSPCSPAGGVGEVGGGEERPQVGKGVRKEECCMPRICACVCVPV